MMANPSSGRRGMMWAVLGGLVLVAGIVAIIIVSVTSQSAPTPAPIGRGSESSGGAVPTAAAPTGGVVDPTAAAKGWIPEPITADAETYIRAALEAAATFDTQKSTREAWLDYLDTWFTPDTRFTSEADQRAAMADSRGLLRQGVVLPREQWDSLAREHGRVVAAATGHVAYVAVSDDASGDMSIGTADVTLSSTRSDGSGGETSYDAQVRVSVQVLCGAGSVPTPGTAQQAGDCKIVRYFTEPLEP